MKEQIHWQKLEADSVNGYGIQVTYTFTSFIPDEIENIEKWCNEFIKSGVIMDGVRAYDIDDYKCKGE